MSLRLLPCILRYSCSSTYSLGSTKLIQVHIVHVAVLPNEVCLERLDKLDGDIERNGDDVLEDDQTRANDCGKADLIS